MKIISLSSSTNLLWRAYVFPGAFLVVLGVLIVMMPELLALIVAAIFIFAGSGLLLFGLQVRRQVRSYSKSDDICVN